MAQAAENSPAQKVENGKPTSALVRQVTEKVLAMWRRDLAVARERSGARKSAF